MQPPESGTLPALLDELADDRPDRTVVLDGRRSRTYRALDRRAERVATGLDALGIGPGDRVAVLMENRVEWLDALFGALETGASVVGVSTWAQPDELAYYLRHSDANALVAAPSFLNNDFAAALQDLLDFESSRPGALDAPAAPELDAVVFLGEDRPGSFALEELVALDGDLPAEPNDPDDEALLLYTSGSTAKPKGVVLTHGDVIENSYWIGERMRLDEDDRLWLSSPLFWSYGSANALGATLTHRASMVLQAPFDPEEAVELIDEHGCTVYYGMPNMAREIVDSEAFAPERVRFRTGTTIGSPDDLRYTMDELGVTEVCNIYGSTETYGNCSVTDCRASRETRMHTQGRPLPGQEVAIRDPETGDPIERGDVGEIRVRGRVTPGYHDDPEKNAESFDDEGYFRTGDLGRIDADGRVRFEGRLGDLIKTGGINVSPLEVEEHLLELAAVEQAYVVGVDDPEMDQVVGAAVVPAPDASVSPADVQRHCRDLSAYKRPAEVAVVPAAEVPLTDTGKVKKEELASLF